MRTCTVDGCGRTHYAKALCSMHYARLWRGSDVGAASCRTPEGALLAFVKVAAKSNTDTCIVWPYGCLSNGYGALYYKGAHTTAHRASLIERTGARPDGMCAAHKPQPVCHNRLCINPRHLYWATYKENTADMLEDHTAPRGERHGNASLTASDVRDIRSSALSQSSLAVVHQVNRSCINKIINRKAWRHIK